MHETIAGATRAGSDDPPAAGSRRGHAAWIAVTSAAAVAAALVVLRGGGLGSGAPWRDGARPSIRSEFAARAGTDGARVTFYGTSTVLRDVSLNHPAAMSPVFGRAVAQAAEASSEARHDDAIVQWS